MSDNIVMLNGPSGTVAPGDQVICNLAVTEVVRVDVYTPGVHTTSPIRGDMWCVRVLTRRGSRWLGAKKVIHEGDRVRWER